MTNAQNHDAQAAAPSKADLLSRPVRHIDVRDFDARPIIDAYAQTAYQARNTARAAEIFNMMQADTDCVVILTLAGSLVSAGMKKIIIDLIDNNMVDAIVSSGANVIDQDFFEGLGFKHYIAPFSPDNPTVADERLRELMIDRIYDTLIDEENLRECDDTTKAIFDAVAEREARPYSSRELIAEMGKHLDEHHANNDSFVKTAYRKGVPIFVPAFSDCSAGFGIVLHQAERRRAGKPAISFDSGKDFLELTEIKLANPCTGLFMCSGGVPKNFVQDIVVSGELLIEKGLSDVKDLPMHKYAVQLTVADARDGALSGSTLREACSWGKVDTVHEQMVFGEVTTLLPIIASDAYHRGHWKTRRERRLNELFAQTEATA